MESIALICPCDIEYNKCKEVFELTSENEIQGRAISEGEINHRKIYAVKAGPGKINTASTTQLVIDKLNPDYIVDVGAAGSLSDKIDISTIIIGSYSYEYDVYPTSELANVSEDIKSKTVYTEDDNLEIIESFLNEVPDEKIILGNIACGEEDVDNTVFRDLLQMRLNAHCCNWESSAILKTANLNNIKAMSFRVITDMADQNMQEKYSKNNERCLIYLFTILKNYINSEYIAQID